MNEKLKTLNTILLVVLALLTLFILGAEPTNPANYNETEFNRFGILLCKCWLVTAVLLVTSLFFTKTKNHEQ